jgi:short subunit dehydrogenase-like uncharacterized protein
MEKSNWLIYGAYGITGQLIVEEALRQGERPVLAGRSAEKLKSLAEKTGLNYIAFDLADKSAVRKALEQVDLVINIAGPFNQTARPLIEACLEKRVNYLDVSNEIEVFQQVAAYDSRAKERGITIICGVGFGTVATNFLAKEIAEQLLDATKLEIAVALHSQGGSAGATKTALEVLASGGKSYRGGKLVNYQLGKGAKKLGFPDGSNRTIMPVPSGDLPAAFQVTAIPEIKTYLEFPGSPLMLRLTMPILQGLMKIKFVRQMAEKASGGSTKSETTPLAPKAEKYSYIWVRATNQEGKSKEGWLKLGEGYLFTAKSSVLAVKKVLELRPIGVLTPAQAFSNEFIQELAV